MAANPFSFFLVFSNIANREVCGSWDNSFRSIAGIRSSVCAEYVYPTFRQSDEGSLVFSIDGVQYKGESYAISDIEAAVVYLESFQGFKYEERVSTGTDTSVSAGDK